MLYSIWGFILIIVPFFAIFFYSSLREGFIKVFSFVFTFNLALSIITQIFHIFNLPVIIGSHIAFILILYIFVYFRTKKSQDTLQKSSSLLKNGFKNNWILLIGLFIIFAQLFSVHYLYTGPVQTIRGEKVVSKSNYFFPFVSDEWVTISEIKYSLENNSLPIVNPLDHNIPITNLLFAFPSLLTEIFLITGLNPLTHYWIASILFGLFLCFSVYLLLRAYNLNSKISVMTILFIPYITNSGNMLALWSLLPFTLGTILLIWQLLAQRYNYNLYAIIFAILALIIYPPMVVFVIPALFIYLYLSLKERKKNILKFIIPVSIIFIVFLLFFYLFFNKAGLDIIGIMKGYIIRPNLDIGIISYPIWHIIPVIVIIFAILGIYQSIKNKYYQLLTVFVVGILYWILYLFLNKVIIIEYPRVVFITSIFLIIFAGQGINLIVNLLVKNNNPKKNAKNKKSFLNVLLILVMVTIIFLIPSYSSRSHWKKLTLKIKDESGKVRVIIPASPINRYINNDDLRLFENIHNENFISPPWKGLVIGAATGNFPFESKPSTIANKIFSYYDFMNLNCEDKRSTAKQFYLSYIYSDDFSCPSFEKIGSSFEDLHLYKYIK